MKRILLLAATLALTLNAAAQKKEFTASPDKTQVLWSLESGHESIKGTFHLTAGSIHFDAATNAISGKLVVSAVSGESGNGGRDKKMQKEVLESPKFTDIVFEPTAYTGKLALTGDSEITVTGNFTVHGSAHVINVPMKIHAEGDTLTATGGFDVPFVEWGMKDPSFLVFKVAKVVKIDLTLVGTVQ